MKSMRVRTKHTCFFVLECLTAKCYFLALFVLLISPYLLFKSSLSNNKTESNLRSPFTYTLK